MSITIDGTTGISGVAGTASTPAVQGEDTNTGIFFPAADTVAVATAGAERMRITSAGNVGIGTTTPTDQLQLVGGNILIGTDSGDPFNANSKFKIQGAGNEYIQIKGDSTGSVGLLFGDATDNFTAGILSSQPEDNLIFHAGNAERVRIAETGHVGIGTDTPNNLLDVAGAAEVIARFYRTDSTLALLRVGNSTTLDGGQAPEFGSDGANAVIHNANAERFRIGSAGQIGIGGANYGTSGQVLTSGGSGTAPSWESVGTAIAGFTTASVGTFAFCNNQSGATINESATVAGSSLRLSDSRDVSGSALAGTWRNMGKSIVTGGPATLFLRIS